MFTRNSVPFCLTVMVMQFPNMRTKQALNLCQRQWGKQLPSVQIMLDFPEDPGSSLSCTSYHQSISSRIVEHSPGFKRVSYVAIRDNRNGNLLLNCPNAVVFSFTIEQTGASASMNGQGLNATVFGQLGNLYTVTVFRRPTRANLQRNRNVHRADNRRQDRLHLIGVLQKG